VTPAAVFLRQGRMRAALRKGYYAAMQVAECRLFGSKLQELRWRIHRVYERSDDHLHRAFLVERIGRFAPFESVLEVGCNCGSNLAALAQAYPAVKLYGVDISAKAIRAAKTTLAARETAPPVDLFVGRAEDLRRFADHSVDIVLTDATLMYVGPDRITAAIAELTRVARRMLVLNEWHLFRDVSSERAHWHYYHWVHDFREALRGVPGVKAFRVERLPPGLFEAGGGWERYGAWMEVET